ncbi:GNAT family N-acetyltransferase [Rhodovibrionaceae bacterium A322]
MNLRPYKDGDQEGLLQLFRLAVQEGAKAHYSQAERDAWAPAELDRDRLNQKNLDNHLVLAVEGGDAEDLLLGFADLTEEGEIDRLFVHPDHHRKGVARALYQALEAEARQRGLRTLTSHASYLARPFFESQGFTMVRRQENPRGGEVLINFFMTKTL